MTTRGWVITAAGFAIPVGGIGEPKVVVIVLALVLLAALLVIGRSEGRALPEFPWGAAWLAGAILLWAALSALWSLDPGGSVKKLLDLFLTAAAALLLLGCDRRLTPRDGQAFGAALAGGVAIAVIVQWSELATGGFLALLVHDTSKSGLSLLVRGISVAAIVLWPALIFLYRAGARGPAIVLCAAAVATLWFTEGTAAALSLTIGAGAALVFTVLPRKAVGVLAMVAALWVLAAPFAMNAATTAVIESPRLDQGAIKDSALHRLVIWRFTSDRILQKPVLGYGLRAGRNVPGSRRMVELPQGDRLVERHVFSLHPHNGPLEWWLELGLPGAVLGALCVFFLFRWPGRLGDRTTRALVVGQLVTAFGIFNLSYGAWQVWWLTALVLAAFLTLVAVESAERADLPLRTRPTS